MKDTIWIKKGRFTPLAVVLMFAFPLVTALICLCFGRMNVPVGEVLTALRTALTGESTSNVQNYSIVINLRLPRILTAIIVGAGLSCAGNAYQSLFSNPLATPDILGVTSGTCVGAILAIILSCSILETQLIALVFGLISVCFTLKVAGKSDGRSMVYLVLAGTIASSLFNALGSLLKYTADPQDKLPEITYWLLGSFTSASYQKILIGCPLIVAGIIIIYLLRWRLNILSLSDDEARTSGINIKQTRMLFIVASTLVTASARFHVRSGGLDWSADPARIPDAGWKQQPLCGAPQSQSGSQLYDPDRYPVPQHQHYRAASFHPHRYHRCTGVYFSVE